MDEGTFVRSDEVWRINAATSYVLGELVKRRFGLFEFFLQEPMTLDGRISFGRNSAAFQQHIGLLLHNLHTIRTHGKYVNQKDTSVYEYSQNIISNVANKEKTKQKRLKCLKWQSHCAGTTRVEVTGRTAWKGDSSSGYISRQTAMESPNTTYTSTFIPWPLSKQSDKKVSK